MTITAPLYDSFEELVITEGMAAWRGTRKIRGRRNHGGPPCPARHPRLHLAAGTDISAGCDSHACEEDLEDTLLERARRLGLWDYPKARPVTSTRPTTNGTTRATTRGTA